MAEARYVRELDLRGGGRVGLRPIRADDESLLHEAFSRMSERSVYFRFFSPLKKLPEDLAFKFSHVDYSDRFAVVATTALPQRPEAEHIVGVGRYDRVPATDVAEVAVAVIDDFQRKGLGSGLLTLVAAAARDHGIRSFSLIVMPENQSMFKLLRSLGWIHTSKFRGGVYEISFPLEPEDD